jgi:hypothetical protein
VQTQCFNMEQSITKQELSVRDGIRIKYTVNSWMSWFIFNLRKINTRECYSQNLYMHRNGSCQLSEVSICSDGMNIYSYRTIMHNDQCTYLISGLLVAPRKSVLHGLVPGMYWAHLWPLHRSMHRVATPNLVCTVKAGNFVIGGVISSASHINLEASWWT